jgi:uncharacterized ion transporter superfamily protein YfcC
VVNVVMLRVIMLSVVMLSIVMLNVVAPYMVTAGSIKHCVNQLAKMSVDQMVFDHKTRNQREKQKGERERKKGKQSGEKIKTHR